MNKYELINKFNSYLIYFPYSFIMQCKNFAEYIISSELRLELKNNKKLKGMYKGKRCFIIGNGPSIKNQDLTLLKNEFTFVTNNFILHERVSEINPSFYCIVDPNMYTGEFPIERLYQMDKILTDTVYFFRYKAKEYVEKNKLFENEKVHYLKNDAYLNDLLNLSMKLDWCMPGTVNVIHTCIIIAAYMGFEEINLVGCDSTLFIPRPGHFYNMTDEEKKAEESLDQKLFYTSYMFKSYRILKEFCDKKNISVYNATEGGVLEVFPRVNYENIVRPERFENSSK